MSRKPIRVNYVIAVLTLSISFFTGCVSSDEVETAEQYFPPTVNAPESRSRVIISTDVGGTDNDDFQSMVHVLLYADMLDIEGIISSPHGKGRVQDVHSVIDCYEQDYPNLVAHSAGYPTPEALRAITKQGALDFIGPEGVSQVGSEGSQWIIDCARRDDPRPLHVLVWGGIEDLAQVLHDAPDIIPKLRAYFIGGPNKKWSPGAYNYIVLNHPDLWIIEANSTYRGWFVGGNQLGDWHPKYFVYKHIKGHGALGSYFLSKMDEIKMGDTPSYMRLLYGVPEDPSQPSWGGQYVRAWKRPYLEFDRLTTCADTIELFGILELNLPLDTANVVTANMVVENQTLPGLVQGGTIKFVFSPKSPREFHYTIESNDASLDGKTGCITGYIPPANVAATPDPAFPNWWTDDLSPDLAEGDHSGAKTISQFREEFLSDFKIRMDRCLPPAI
jgi:hypothetical protein